MIIGISLIGVAEVIAREFSVLICASCCLQCHCFHSFSLMFFSATFSLELLSPTESSQKIGSVTRSFSPELWDYGSGMIWSLISLMWFSCGAEHFYVGGCDFGLLCLQTRTILLSPFKGQTVSLHIFLKRFEAHVLV